MHFRDEFVYDRIDDISNDAHIVDAKLLGQVLCMLFQILDAVLEGRRMGEGLGRGISSKIYESLALVYGVVYAFLVKLRRDEIGERDFGHG